MLNRYMPLKTGAPSGLSTRHKEQSGDDKTTRSSRTITTDFTRLVKSILQHQSRPASPPPLKLTGWPVYLLVLFAGLLTPLAFAPFNIWPLSILSPAVLAFALISRTAKEALWLGFWFGMGLYGSGASWVYISIHEFGFASVFLATLLTGIFIIVLSLVFSLPFYLFGRWFNHGLINVVLGFSACWILGEWLRSWVFTGFPWLYLGYAHLTTWLSGWAPVLGIFGLSWMCAITAAGITACGLYKRKAIPAALLIAAIWPLGGALSSIQWTTPFQAPVTIGLAQGNIPQELKWHPDFLEPTLTRYSLLSESLWEKDIIVWPEAAIPLLYHSAIPFLDQLSEQADATSTAFITGILYDDPIDKRYYNAIMGLGLGNGMYHKQRLVPFGEYVPLEKWLRGLIAFFNLPMSVISPGPGNQTGLAAGDIQLAPFICYEVVYPELVATNAAQSHVLITISNDAWFGDSIGPLQHLEMAQMRALETGRYLIRATNDGVSAIVNEKGEILKRSQRFVQQSLSGTIQPMTGATPYMQWGNLPVLAGGFILLLLCVFLSVKQQGRNQTN